MKSRQIIEALVTAAIIILFIVGVSYAEAWNHELLCELTMAGHQVTGPSECTTVYQGSNAFIQVIEKTDKGILEHYAIYKEAI